MYGNLKILEGRTAFDGYSHRLRRLGGPFLPYLGVPWIIRAVLVVGVLVHIFAAVALWRRSRSAPAVVVAGGYQSNRPAAASSAALRPDPPR
jgi:succinate dehydrogenase / fumarate reductase cytochrome b subunit